MGWSSRARPRQQAKLARGSEDEEHAMSPKLNSAIAVIGRGKSKRVRARDDHAAPLECIERSDRGSGAPG